MALARRLLSNAATSISLSLGEGTATRLAATMDCIPVVLCVICSLTASAVAAHLPGCWPCDRAATEHGPPGPRAASWPGHT
jgi:hypothetical protein